MIKSTNYWWNNIDKLSEPLEPLTKELFEEFLKDYSKTPPEYFYLIEKKKEKKVKAVKVIENNWSKILCHIFNIFAITFYHYILLGCYCEYYYSKEEVLLNQLPHYYHYRTNKWYIFKHIWKLLRKEK